MAKQPKTLDDLFPTQALLDALTIRRHKGKIFDGIKDIYFAEKKILVALPRMAKAAQSQELAAAFEKHHTETEAQVERLEEVFALLEKKPQGKNCPAILGLVEEGTEVMSDYKESPALDAGLLAAAQSVEHYEISRYGTLKAWAEQLGLGEAVTLLDTTLKEEKATDEALSALAEAALNPAAEAE